MQKAKFVRKACDISDLRDSIKEYNTKAEPYVIEKVIELTKEQFEYLVNDFFAIRKWIAENVGKMWYENGTWHCILAKTKDCTTAILIESEGYDYARYTAEIELKEKDNG